MSIAPSSFRRRIRRASSMEGPQSFWGRLLKLSLAQKYSCGSGSVLAAFFLLVLLRGWSQPFAFRLGSVAPRGVVSRVAFEKPDLARTRAAQQRATSQVRVVYIQDRSPLVRIRDGLKNRVAEIAAAETLAGVSRAAWLEFAPETAAVLERSQYRLRNRSKTCRVPIAPDPPDFSMQEEPEDKGTPSSLGQTCWVHQKPNLNRKMIAERKTPVTEDIGLANDVIRAQAQPKVDSETASEDQAKHVKPSVTEFSREKLQAEQAFTAFRNAVATKEKLLEFNKAIDRAFCRWSLKVFLKKFSMASMREAKQKLMFIHLAT